MRADSFDYGMLGQRTYWDFYFGYGLIAVVLAVLITAVIAIATSDRNTQMRLSACALTTVLAHAAIIARYFFVLPLAFDLVVAVLLAAALVYPSRREHQRYEYVGLAPRRSGIQCATRRRRTAGMCSVCDRFREGRTSARGRNRAPRATVI
jgi:chromate transport protein ChrA